MSWNFKMSWEQFEAEYIRIARDIDRLYMPLKKYYELYEPKRFDALIDKLLEADRKFSPTEDWQEIIKEQENMRYELDKDRSRLSRPISEAEVKRVHVLKGKLNLDDQQYRDLMYREVGKSSSKDLLYWEAMVFLRALYNLEKGVQNG